jgi:hypothetical protein
VSAAPVGLDGEQAIRDALAAGPTPGPWMVPHFARDEVKCNCGYVFSEFQHGMGSICEVNHGAEDEPIEVAKANARLIAACNPETMRALLAELDRLRSASRQEGWISVEERLPETGPDEEGIHVWTWDGVTVERDEFVENYEQPAGPAVGGWLRTDDWFAGDIDNRVTHWQPYTPPAAPHQAQEAQGDRHGE